MKMKKFLKIASVILVIAALVTAFTACGGKQETEKKALVFGTNAEFPPFEFVNSEGGTIDKFDGIDMGIAKKIGEDLDMEAKIENIEFDSLIVALNNGQVDALIAGMTINEERKQSVDFSIPYYTAVQVMIVKTDSDIKSAADMKDKRIAVVQGYTGESCVKDLAEKNGGYNYEAFKKGTEAILELENGRCDVVVIDSITAQNFIGDKQDLKIVEDSTAFESEQYGIAVKKGNTELLEKINASLEKMLADGTIDNLAVKFG